MESLRDSVVPVNGTWSRIVVRSFQLETLQYLSDVPLVRLHCDAVTTPFNDTIQYSALFSRSASSPITFFLTRVFSISF